MNSETSPKRFPPFLFLTALVCGAAVMEIEVLGSRVIGPFFGVSLFVWTSLITVTLVALAAGYWLGGRLADRHGHARMMYALIMLSGVFVLLVPWIKAAVLKATLSLGLQLGAFTSATVLFGPALLLLGCVSPYLVKIAAREVHNIGATVGGLYALSTVGSVVGTLLTGFYLIGYVSVNHTFVAIGASLMLLAVIYFVAFNRAYPALAALALPWLLWPNMTTPPITLDDGTQARVTFAQDTFYGAVKVVDYTYDDQHVRELLIDGAIQGTFDVNSGLSANRYHYALQALPYSYNPDGHDCLVIGLGAGFVPTWYARQGVRTDVVEIDPLIPKLARRYFGFKINGDVFNADARHYLLTTERRYDYIILDAYNGDLTPNHLTTREIFELVKARLKPGGVLAINFIGSVGPDRIMTASVLKTLRAVFAAVEVFPIFDLHDPDGIGNFEILAHEPKTWSLDMPRLGEFPIHPRVRDIVLQSIAKPPFDFPDDPAAMVLTDDYNPIDFFDAKVREAVRRRIIEGNDWDLLIG